MSVQFVLGRAGSGKSEYIYKKILSDAKEHRDKNFYLFVPEQYTLTAQLKLLELSDSKALFNVEALSFSRFSRRVFNELGTGTLDVLEDTGKSLLISKILKEKNDSLSTLKNSLMNQGGVEELKSLFSEFCQYGVKSEDLREVFSKDGIDPFFKKKGEDIITLFDAFKEEISGRFFTAEELPELLCDVIDSSLLVKNSEFYFDGYTGFTPVQYNVIEKMMKLSERLVFSFTIGENEGLVNKMPSSEASESDVQKSDIKNSLKRSIKETDLFYMSEQSINKIISLAEFTGTNILKDIIMPSPSERRFKEGGKLLFLEENIFSKEPKDYHEYENHIKDDLSILLLQNPRDEISFVCSEISRLLRTGDYHYRDFAVLCAGTGDFEDDAPHIFESYHIPYFLDSNVSIFFNPLLEFIESALRIIRYNFKSEDVINFMRTGLTDFSFDETDLFDDYLFLSGYQGYKAFSSDFRLIPDGFPEEDLLKVNEIRRRLLEGEDSENEKNNNSSCGINSFREALNKKGLTYKNAATALFNLFTAYDVEEKLYEMHISFEKENDEIHSKEYEEIYEKVIEVLDRMVRLLGENPCTKDEFSDDLLMLLSSINVGVLPYSNDCVVIGDMERSRLSEIKVLFLIGCHDGNIPGSFGSGGLLSDSEREKLESLDFALAPTNREKAFIKKFYLYLALSRSSEKLYISFTKKDKAGNSVLPSYLVLDILKLFPDMSVIIVQKNAHDFIYSKETLFPFLASGLRNYVLDKDKKDALPLFDAFISNFSEEKKSVSDNATGLSYESLKDSDDIKIQDSLDFMSKLLNAVFYDGSIKVISEELIRETHSDEDTGEIFVKGSISNIEKYYECPYEYFLQYELGLTEKQGYGMNSLDLGNIYHHVLQAYSNKVLKKYKDFTEIPDDKSKELLSDCVDEELKSLTGKFLFASGFEIHIVENIKKTIFKAVHAFTMQLKRGIYRPRKFEYKFNDELLINDTNNGIHDAKLKFDGKIDRIDTALLPSGDSIFVRVVDYKSGNKTLDLKDVENGLELQLFTYLDAALKYAEMKENEYALKIHKAPRKIIPGGVYFSRIKNPILNEKENKTGILIGAEDYERALLSSYKMLGITENSYENFKAVDDDLFNSKDGFKSSPVTGFSINKNGTIHTGTNDSKNLDDIMAIIKNVHEEETIAAGNILSGRFEKYPYLKSSSGGTKTEKTACAYCAYFDVCLFDRGLKGNSYHEL